MKVMAPRCPSDLTLHVQGYGGLVLGWVLLSLSLCSRVDRMLPKGLSFSSPLPSPVPLLNFYT